MVLYDYEGTSTICRFYDNQNKRSGSKFLHGYHTYMTSADGESITQKPIGSPHTLPY